MPSESLEASQALHTRSLKVLVLDLVVVLRRATHWNKDWRGPIGGWSPVMACLVETTASDQRSAGRQQRRIAPGAMLDGSKIPQLQDLAIGETSRKTKARWHPRPAVVAQGDCTTSYLLSCPTCLCLVLQPRTSFFLNFGRRSMQDIQISVS